MGGSELVCLVIEAVGVYDCEEEESREYAEKGAGVAFDEGVVASPEVVGAVAFEFFFDDDEVMEAGEDEDDQEEDGGDGFGGEKEGLRERGIETTMLVRTARARVFLCTSNPAQQSR